jgi:hypothetical protein
MNIRTVNIAFLCFLTACLVGCNEPENAEVVNNVVQHKEEQPQIRIVQEEVPEYISNRGVILRGKDTEYSHRADPDPDFHALWYDRYTADCNLSVDSTDSEFEEFVKNIDEKATFPSNNAGCIQKMGKNGCPEYMFQIHRTCMDKNDISQGYIMYYVEEGMSCGTPVYFDPSGKYIFDTSLWDGRIPDDILIKFLEPEMVEVKYNPDFLGMGEDVILTETEDIEKVLDIMHSLEVRLEKDEHPELAMAEYQSILSFTDINGNVNDYKIIGAYLIHGDDVYFVENNDKLDELEANYGN